MIPARIRDWVELETAMNELEFIDGCGYFFVLRPADPP